MLTVLLKMRCLMGENAIRFLPSRTFEGKRRNKSLKEASQ